MNRYMIESVFYSPPEIYTERLILRAISSKDAPDMFEYSSDENVTKYLTWETHCDLHYTKSNIKRILKAYKSGRFFDWALVLKSTGKMIGTCGFTSFSYLNDSCEIGYVVNPAYHGCGIATEGASRVIEFAFGVLGAKSVVAKCMEENIASIRVMEKCGMVFDAKIARGAVKQNRYVDVIQYKLTKERYELKYQIPNGGI
ncbi:MAG: GNAT family N-acetyltransferase [Clostridia bacterium]|nr:GNAT family N-acetyltransferase [Clostridia bacterium]